MVIRYYKGKASDFRLQASGKSSGEPEACSLKPEAYNLKPEA
jgi:hypothetical protein